MRKQDIIFAILKQHAKSGEDIFADGVLRYWQDGFGFLRSADSPTSPVLMIFTFPSQIRRFNLRTGDTISGKIRPPKEGERYFARSVESHPKLTTTNRKTPVTKSSFENFLPRCRTQTSSAYGAW